MIHQNCYFYSTIDDFLKTSDSDILKSLKDGSAKLYNKPAEDSQIRRFLQISSCKLDCNF